MAHFIELLLKHHVSQKHPLLIFASPFAQKLDRTRTIGLWEAINFINNESPESVSEAFRKDLEWLKKLRNDIEHHKFNLNVAQTRKTLGRLFRSVLEFLDKFSEIELDAHVSKEAVRTFRLLSDEYEFERTEAIKAADISEEDLRAQYGEAAVVRLQCPACDSSTLLMNSGSETGYRCIFCGEQESEEIPAHCDLCGERLTKGDLVYWENEYGDREGRCYFCSGQYQADKDD
jgi:hypothetical protein